MTRAELGAQGFDFYCYHLLCRAVEDRAKFEALGNECHLLAETMCTQKFTVYFLGMRKLHRPTRKERGCYV
jgi:hypothetical protein